MPPNPWGCLSRLFPEKSWFVWRGRGQQGLQPCPLESRAMAAPAWGQMPSAGAILGVLALAPSPEAWFYGLVLKPDFYEAGTRLWAPAWRAVTPLAACTQLLHRLLLGTFGFFLPSICPFIRSPLQILGASNRQDSIPAMPPVTSSN